MAYSICLPLSDLLILSIMPSKSIQLLQMAKFHCFSCLSNIPLYVCVCVCVCVCVYLTSSLYPVNCWWTFSNFLILIYHILTCTRSHWPKKILNVFLQTVKDLKIFSPKMQIKVNVEDFPNRITFMFSRKSFSSTVFKYVKVKRQIWMIIDKYRIFLQQPGWEGSLGENEYMYMYGWVALLCTWNYHNIVNRLYSNIK